MAMANSSGNQQQQQEKSQPQHRSIFDLPSDFFSSSHLLSPHSFSSPSIADPTIHDALATSAINTLTLASVSSEEDDGGDPKNGSLSRWSCNTCRAEFESLQDQRSHFKSDIHRFNVKLSIAGKEIVKEEDVDESNADSLFRDSDLSSISGSEDETDKRYCNDAHRGSILESIKQKLCIHLQSGERVSVWKSSFLDESVKVLYDHDGSSDFTGNGGKHPCLRESEVIEKLKSSINEPRDKTNLRAVLLASGGHFAGCVFDGNLTVAHKTFHRYVVRAKAGKKQSSKDGSGKAANSAGASIRRHNELALKKDIQETLAAWKPLLDACSCVFIYAPSSNRQLLFNGEKPYLLSGKSAVRNIPLTVRRPTLKEAQRIYHQLMQVTYEVDKKEVKSNIKEDSTLLASAMCNYDSETNKVNTLESTETIGAVSNYKKSDEVIVSTETEIEDVWMTTPLHEAAKSGNSHKVLELLEQGLDPCIKDESGRTPYMLATEKEVRNSFRRFMAVKIDKWDWVAAKVPSALTKEMEDSQAAKQAEKDAKKKARAKELKKLRKAREKKAQTLDASSAEAGKGLENKLPTGQSSSGTGISKEEELERSQAAEREKRAAAAERRMAASVVTKAQDMNMTIAPSCSQPRSGIVADVSCSCCNASLAGKIPFHRYNYKYCSTTCMHVHREALEDE